MPVMVKQVFNEIQRNMDRLPMAQDRKRTVDMFHGQFTYHWLPILADTKIDDVTTTVLLNHIESVIQSGLYLKYKCRQVQPVPLTGQPH